MYLLHFPIMKVRTHFRTCYCEACSVSLATFSACHVCDSAICIGSSI